jgi:chromosome segregation ATPase
VSESTRTNHAIENVGSLVKAAINADSVVARLKEKRLELVEQIKYANSQYLQEKNLEKRAAEYVKRLKKKLREAESTHSKHAKQRERWGSALDRLKRREKAKRKRLTGRLLDLNRTHRSFYLKETYKDLGLPVPKDLVDIRPVANRKTLEEISNQLEDTNEMDQHTDSG